MNKIVGLLLLIASLASADSFDISGNYSIYGPVNPSVTAVNAPEGWLYQDSANGTVYVKQDYGLSTNWMALGSGGGGGAVSSFNTRTGAVTLNSTDVTVALGYTPAAVIEAHGSAASPVSIVPSSGIAATSANDQVWWVTPSTAVSGAVLISATPQIAAGSAVGQRLTLFGVTNGSGGYLEIVDGRGVANNGDFDMITGQAIVYQWNGTVWQFVSNAI